MNDEKRTPQGRAITDLILDMFRVSSGMTTAGDRLVAELGLTSARWQILGSIIASDRPQPVAWLARDMGGSRQNIQRIVKDLVRENLVMMQPNPHHRRAPLVVLTPAGHDAYEAAMALQVPWINALADGISMDDIAVTHRVITALRDRLEAVE